MKMTAEKFNSIFEQAKYLFDNQRMPLPVGRQDCATFADTLDRIVGNSTWKNGRCRSVTIRVACLEVFHTKADWAHFKFAGGISITTLSGSEIITPK